jgi:hypothetical protein
LWRRDRGYSWIVKIPGDDFVGISNQEDSTIPEDPSSREYRREKWLRNSTMLFVVSVVVLSALGILGVKASTATVDGSGYRMEVTYATVTRGGLATPFAINVSAQDGSTLPDVVTIRVSSDYLALFDDNGMEPTPANSFNSETFTSWDFELPPGETILEVVLDARLEPAVQWGKAATVELWVGGARRLSTEFQSWVMP